MPNSSAPSSPPGGAPSTLRRLLALRLPRLSTDRIGWNAGSGGPPGEPLVVAAKERGAWRLTAVCAAAGALGLRPGMTLAHARALHPSIRVEEADEAADAAFLEAVAEWCDRFTPLVALDPPQGLLLDVTGCTHLFGGEEALSDRIRSALAARGFKADLAIAGTPAAARAFALGCPGRIVPPGREAEALAHAPPAALGLAPDVLRGLSRAGLETVAALAARPRAELAARFGAGLVATLDEAFGLSQRPIAARRPVPDLIAEQRFPDPVATEAAVRDALRALARTLCTMLERRQEGARLMEAAVFRSDGKVRRIAVETGRPVRDPDTVDRLFRERLDGLSDPLDPGFGFDLVRLSAHRLEPLRPRMMGLDAREADDEEVLGLIDRLAARLGPRRVLRFAASDTHIPEAQARAVPAQALADPSWPRAYNHPPRDPGEAPRRPLSLFDPPEPVEVLAEVPEGAPARFRWRRVLHQVVRAEGPERIAPEWWRSQAPGLTRDYYRIEDAEGRRYWIFRQGLYGRETEEPLWFMHGLFA